jgi:hypothetical protein
MPDWMLHRAMIITLCCAVLLRLSPPLASAIGTSTTVKPVSQTTALDVPRDGEGREGRERPGLSLPFFIIGVFVGGLLGLLGYRVLHGWRARHARQRDIDRLTAQFQALFRESDQGKNHIPPDLVVRGITTHRKPPDVRIWRLRNQSRVGTVPPSTSTPHWPACWARR